VSWCHPHHPCQEPTPIVNSFSVDNARLLLQLTLDTCVSISASISSPVWICCSSIFGKPWQTVSHSVISAKCHSHSCHTSSDLNMTFRCLTHYVTSSTFSMAMRSGWYGGKRRTASSWAFNRSSRTYLVCLSLHSFIKAPSFNFNKSPMHGFFSAATKFSSFLDENLGSYN